MSRAAVGILEKERRAWRLGARAGARSSLGEALRGRPQTAPPAEALLWGGMSGGARRPGRPRPHPNGATPSRPSLGDPPLVRRRASHERGGTAIRSAESDLERHILISRTDSRMRRRVAGTAAALSCLATAHGWASPPPISNPAAEASMTLSFFAVADWGGQAAPPYTTTDQLGASATASRAGGLPLPCCERQSPCAPAPRLTAPLPSVPASSDGRQHGPRVRFLPPALRRLRGRELPPRRSPRRVSPQSPTRIRTFASSPGTSARRRAS